MEWDIEPAADGLAYGPEILPPREPLTPAFALRLADRRGVSGHASYKPGEIYSEPPRGEMECVLELGLPLGVFLKCLHCGILIFDFAANSDFCGGELPSLSVATQSAFQTADASRKALVAKRTRYINAFLTTLWVGGQQAEVGIGPQSPLHLGNFQSAAQVDGDWRVYGPGSAPPIGGWPPVNVYLPGNLFRNAAVVFEKIHSAFGQDTFELLSLLQDCAAHFQNHQFSAALVIGWSVAEAVLSRRWRAYIAAADKAKGGHTVVTKARRERLNGRDFTASVVIEALSLAGKLSEHQRETLDVARRTRNKFAHELLPCEPGQSFLAASVAAQMIGEEAGCDFRVGSAYSYQT